MSAQTSLTLPLQIQRRPFLFLSSLKIFQPKFSPLSHFPLTFHYSIKSKHEVGSPKKKKKKHEVGLKFLHLGLNWSGFEELTSVHCKDHLNTICDLLPSAYISISLSIVNDHLNWSGYGGISLFVAFFSIRCKDHLKWSGYWWVCWSGFFSMDSSSIFLSFL